MHVTSRYFFADPTAEVCQQLIGRLFEVEEVRALEILPARAWAQIEYRNGLVSARSVVQKIARHLQNGHDGRRPPYVNSPRDLPRAGADEGWRVERHGEVLSTWEIVHELPGRIRVRNRLIRRNQRRCAAIEGVLMRALGVDRYATGRPASGATAERRGRDTRSRSSTASAGSHPRRRQLDGRRDRPLPRCRAARAGRPARAHGHHRRALRAPAGPRSGLGLRARVRRDAPPHRAVRVRRRRGGHRRSGDPPLPDESRASHARELRADVPRAPPALARRSRARRGRSGASSSRRCSSTATRTRSSRSPHRA